MSRIVFDFILFVIQETAPYLFSRFPVLLSEEDEMNSEKEATKTEMGRRPSSEKRQQSGAFEIRAAVDDTLTHGRFRNFAQLRATDYILPSVNAGVFDPNKYMETTPSGSKRFRTTLYEQIGPIAVPPKADCGDDNSDDSGVGAISSEYRYHDANDALFREATAEEVHSAVFSSLSREEAMQVEVRWRNAQAFRRLLDHDLNDPRVLFHMSRIICNDGQMSPEKFDIYQKHSAELLHLFEPTNPARVPLLRELSPQISAELLEVAETASTAADFKSIAALFDVNDDALLAESSPQSASSESILDLAFQGMSLAEFRLWNSTRLAGKYLKRKAPVLQPTVLLPPVPLLNDVARARLESAHRHYPAIPKVVRPEDGHTAKNSSRADRTGFFMSLPTIETGESGDVRHDDDDDNVGEIRVYDEIVSTPKKARITKVPDAPRKKKLSRATPHQATQSADARKRARKLG